MLTRSTICLAILGAAAPAYALKPQAHGAIAQQSCVTVGLPHDLCQRIATEDYNTDSREWDDLRAHAQIDDGQTACGAADATSSRVWTLGHDIRAQLVTLASSNTYENAGEVSSLIGRALHTIQDDCAHHGMPNPQHAWFSLGDFCDGTQTSPDLQDDALACARAETDAVMKVVATELERAGVVSLLAAESCPPASNDDHNNQPSVCSNHFLPGPFDACGFLGRAKDWDGIDRTWNNAVVVPALRAAFTDGLLGGSEPVPMCNGDERVLSNATSQPTVDVSTPPRCVKASVLCLGKADDDVESPFADDPLTSGGCSTSGDGAGTGTLAALAVFAALAVLRRRP